MFRGSAVQHDDRRAARGVGVDPLVDRGTSGCRVALDDKGFVKTGPDLSSDELANTKWPLARPPYLFETSRGGNVKRVADCSCRAPTSHISCCTCSSDPKQSSR